MASSITASSNAAQQCELALLKRIKIEQTFANQVYANFKSLRFGIDSCCYEDFQQAILRKDICDWQNAASDKIVVATDVNGVFVEPLARIDTRCSMSCPETPSNVCTVLDLEDLMLMEGTYTQCFQTAAIIWTITHNLGSFPSVTIVDTNSVIVVGDVDYLSSNIVQVTFALPFAGCAFLN